MEMAFGRYEMEGGKQVFKEGGNQLAIVDIDNAQFDVIRSWNKMRWDKKNKALTGTADLELLDHLAGLARLPPNIERRRAELRAVRDAVDQERVNPEPKPLYQYPVKMPLYAHQVRGANMALLTFGWTPHERSVTA